MIPLRPEGDRIPPAQDGAPLRHPPVPEGAGHRIRVRTLAAGVALLGLQACGGGGGGGSDPSPTGSAPTLLIRTDAVGAVRAPFDVQFLFSATPAFPSGSLPFALNGARVVDGSFKALSPDTWQVTLRPDPNSQRLIELRVPAGAYTDASGRFFSTTAYEFAQPCDTRVPFASLSFSGPVGFLGAITGPGTFTLTFDAVLDAPLAADVLQVSAGTISGLRKTSPAGQRDAYAFEYAPPAGSMGGVLFELPKDAVRAGGLPNDRNWWTFALATPP